MSQESTTALLIASSKGVREATDALADRIYDDLRALARRRLSREPLGHPFRPTDLVHEAYVRLVDQDRINWKGRSHFLAVAGNMMRRVLIDEARRRLAQKRGGGGRRVTWRGAEQVLSSRPEVDLMPLADALERLQRMNQRHAKLASLKLFTALGDAEIAGDLGIAERTVRHDWQFVKTWLEDTLKDLNHE